MKKLMSQLAMMQKSDGNINAEDGRFTDAAEIIGDYEQIDAPDNWQEILLNAADNTYRMDRKNFELGKQQDWVWWRENGEDEQGYCTGIDWLVAQWREESSSEDISE